MANDQKTKDEQVINDDIIDVVAEEVKQASNANTEEAENTEDIISAEAGDGQAADQVVDQNTEQDLDLVALLNQLQAAQQESADLKEQLLRSAADVQNVRRRAEQDVEKAHKFALDKFVNEMLPVVDNLERTIDACSAEDETTKSLREGVELTLTMFISGMAKFKVVQVDPQGEAFDPVLHQAMSMVDMPDVPPNTVMAVMQKGYTLNGRLVRPAMVMVSKS